LNKNLVRLKDIKELFLDTGIGDGAYSIVNQGQVDLLLSSKPEDRRSVFEEAAGINKYKFRKKAAERRLIATEQNLLRVNDLRNEIKENLNSLEEQAIKAQKYKEAKEKLKVLEIGLAKKQIKSLTDRISVLKEKIEDLKNKTTGVENNFAKEEEEKNRLKSIIKDSEISIENIRIEIENTKSLREKNLTLISVNKERISQLEERLHIIENEIEKLNNTKDFWLKKHSEKDENLSNFYEQSKISKEKFESAEKLLEEINKKIEQCILGWNNLKNPIFEREIEITSQKHKISELSLSIKYAEESLQKEKSFLENLLGLKEDINLLEQETSNLEGISNELKERISQRKVEIFKKIDMEIEVLEKNISVAEKNIKKIEEDKQKETQTLENLQNNVDEMNQKFSFLEIQLNQLNAEKEQAIISLAEARANLNNNETLLKQKIEEEKALKEQIDSIELQINEKNLERNSIKQRIEQTNDALSKAEESLPNLMEKEEKLKSEMNEKIKNKLEAQAKLENLEEKLKDISSEDRIARDELSKEEIALAKLEGELNSIETLIKQEYEMTIEQAMESPIEEVQNQAKAKEEIEEIKTIIREIGPVNLLAVEEYETIKERMSFIEKQYEDLINARDNLNKLIRQLDNESRERFLATIEVVNKNFAEIFSSLFEGGEAKISLLDGDPLEAGIEIFARPSGKKWLSIALMSGGEKSLTAISILFALIRTKPSPFCFLDEVDAALDEINTIRFAKLLKEFSNNSQIIVVTHSKRTMSAATTMYGITMEEPGVSKLVSMKLVKVAD